ncbi:hypothetical protein Y695_03353 [Hydrogenophaga sp. T4]|nr:hypothetical protein Y695_03353 [Hydrogenophaga sp. T4]
MPRPFADRLNKAETSAIRERFKRFGKTPVSPCATPQALAAFRSFSMPWIAASTVLARSASSLPRSSRALVVSAACSFSSGDFSRVRLKASLRIRALCALLSARPCWVR